MLLINDPRGSKMEGEKKKGLQILGFFNPGFFSVLHMREKTFTVTEFGNGVPHANFPLFCVFHFFREKGEKKALVAWSEKVSKQFEPNGLLQP